VGEAAGAAVGVVAESACFGATFFARDQPCASEEKMVVVVAVVVVVVRRRPFSRNFKFQKGLLPL